MNIGSIPNRGANKLKVMKIKFEQISSNEIKFEYKGFKFLLVEQGRGVYGGGRAVQLYMLDGLKKEHIKEVAWTKDDGNNGMKSSDAIYKELTTLDGCKELATKYLSKLI